MPFDGAVLRAVAVSGGSGRSFVGGVGIDPGRLQQQQYQRRWHHANDAGERESRRSECATAVCPDSASKRARHGDNQRSPCHRGRRWHGEPHAVRSFRDQRRLRGGGANVPSRILGQSARLHRDAARKWVHLRDDAHGALLLHAPVRPRLQFEPRERRGAKRVLCHRRRGWVGPRLLLSGDRAERHADLRWSERANQRDRGRDPYRRPHLGQQRHHSPGLPTLGRRRSSSWIPREVCMPSTPRETFDRK